MRRALAGIAIAALLAVLLAVPEIRGVETWKWVLGVLGLVLYLAGSRRGRRS